MCGGCVERCSAACGAWSGGPLDVWWLCLAVFRYMWCMERRSARCVVVVLSGVPLHVVDRRSARCVEGGRLRAFKAQGCRGVQRRASPQTPI